MSDFNTLLKASFAEAPEPVDDGFSVRISHAVAHREASLKVRNGFQLAGVTIGCAAVSYGAYAMLGAFGQDVLASAGLEIARAHGAISSAPSVGAASQSFLQSMGAGMTQILLVTAALVGGAVAYRASQE